MTESDETSDEGDEGGELEGDELVVVVDTAACIGGGQCEMAAPEVFEVDDDTGIAAVVGSGRLPRAVALDVADRCPGRAISLVEDSLIEDSVLEGSVVEDTPPGS